MADPTGFLKHSRIHPPMRPVSVRLRDWNEVYEPTPSATSSEQASRCMDCGISFCNQGCPLGNKIPLFNDAVYRGKWDAALEILLTTNNFPEFTGRLCPAPCESACVLGIGDEPVSIERIEQAIIEEAFSKDRVLAPKMLPKTGKRVAVVGSGPAGLAAASQLASAGHEVSVFERSDAIGGLLRYGIPNFKMEKRILDRRIDVMRQMNISFFPNVSIGDGGTPLVSLERSFDAVILAIGSTRPRTIAVEGAELNGIYPAMDYLTAATKSLFQGNPPEISANGKNVIILGGGDTGADCLGTAHRQGATSVVQIEIMDMPPNERPVAQPWPEMPRLFKVTSAHEEGGERVFSTETLAFEGDGWVESILTRNLQTNAETRFPADLVLIAAGFLGPELESIGLAFPEHMTARESLSVDENWRISSLGPTSNVFACGDAVRGQSLIVWAIAEGRSAAAAVDEHLAGRKYLPRPVAPYNQQW